MVKLAYRKQASIRTLYQEYERIEMLLMDVGDTNFNSRKFDLFAFSDLIGRENTLPVLAVHLFLQHSLIQHINEQKFSKFLGIIQSTYRQEV